MKNKNIFTSLMIFCLCLIFSYGHSQGLGEIEGTLEIKMNSTTGTPHLRLFEDDTSPGGSTRLSMEHRNGAGDDFELRAFLASTNKRIGWYFNGGGRLVWSETNNGLGINTSTPEAKVHIKSTSSSSHPTLRLEEEVDGQFARLFFSNTTSANRWSLASRNASASDDVIGFYYNSAAKMVYNAALDGLGLGTADPDELLHLNFTGADGIKIEGDGTGDARININNGAGNHWLFDDISDANTLKLQSANEFAIQTGGPNNRIHIKETFGEVGINTDGNSNYRLHVDNTADLIGIFSTNSGGQRTGIQGSVVSTGASTAIGVRGVVSGTTTLTRKGVEGSSSTTPANSWAVYAAGDLWYTGSVKAPSDIRLKKNVQDLAPVLDKVMQLQTKTYEFKRDEYEFANLANGPQIGFIAQNVQELFPTLVEEETHTFQTGIDEENGVILEESLDILGLSSIEMIPILAKAIQEQQVLIDALRQELDEVKKDK